MSLQYSVGRSKSGAGCKAKKRYEVREKKVNKAVRDARLEVHGKIINRIPYIANRKPLNFRDLTSKSQNMLKNLYILLALLLLSSCAVKQIETEVGELLYSDHVIAKDTTWSGDIVIEGVVVVGRKATLKIEPGTTVRFNKIDRKGLFCNGYAVYQSVNHAAYFIIVNHFFH